VSAFLKKVPFGYNLRGKYPRETTVQVLNIFFASVNILFGYLFSDDPF